jgi:hypothetical protein
VIFSQRFERVLLNVEFIELCAVLIVKLDCFDIRNVDDLSEAAFRRPVHFCGRLTRVFKSAYCKTGEAEGKNVTFAKL